MTCSIIRRFKKKTEVMHREMRTRTALYEERNDSNKGGERY